MLKSSTEIDEWCLAIARLEPQADDMILRDFYLNLKNLVASETGDFQFWTKMAKAEKQARLERKRLGR